MKTQKLHRGNLTSDAVFARNGRRIWEARDDLQSIAEGCFKDTVGTALCDLCKEYNIGTGQPDRFGNDATQLIYVEIKSSLGKTQMFVVTWKRVKVSEAGQSINT
jgi:hypothetical protein